MTTLIFLATANWKSHHDWVDQAVLIASGDLPMQDAHIPVDATELDAAHRAQSECPPISTVKTIMGCVYRSGMEAQTVRQARESDLNETDRKRLKLLSDAITVPEETITISQEFLDLLERNEDEIVAKVVAALR